MVTRDNAGTKLLTEGDVFNVLFDGKAIKVETESGVDTLRLVGTKPYLTATDGTYTYSVGDIMTIYGRYHHQFGRNVLFPMNVAEL